MATTKGVSFTCPNCEKVLRAGSRPAEGKKIKCPACAHAFVPQLDEEEEATSIQDRPRIKKPPTRDEDDGDKPRNRKSRADEDEDDDRPSRKRSRDDDDDDRGSRRKKNAKKKSGGGMLMVLLGLFLVGGVGLFACAGCGVGAWWFWPFGGNELMAFVGPDANLLMGGKPRELKTKFSGFKNMLNQAAAQNPQDQFPEMEELVLNSDQFLLFANTKNLGMGGGKGLIVAFKAQQADIDRLKSSKRIEPVKNAGSHAMFKMKNNFGGGGPDIIGITGRYLLISDMDEDQFGKVLDRAKKEAPKSAAIDLSRSVDRSPMWVAFTFDGEVRKQLRELVDMGGAQVPSLKAAGRALDGAKGMTYALDVVGNNDLKMTASVMCKNPGDAQKVKTGMEDGWKAVKVLLDAAMLLGGAPKGPDARAGELLMKDLGSLSFSTSGDNATATLTFNNQTIEELAKGAKNNPFGFVGGPPPPRFDGGPKDFPKFDGGPKDFPKFDGGPKDFPKFDGGPKDFPKFDGVMKDFPKIDGGPKTGKGKLIQTFSQKNIQPGTNRESVFQFQKGKRITITMTSVTKGNTDVDLYVLRGLAGDNIVAVDASIGPNGNVNFIVPETDQYRVQIRNLGQGVATSSTVRIYEQ